MVGTGRTIPEQQEHTRLLGSLPTLPRTGCCLQERHQSMLKEKTAGVFYFSRVWGGQKNKVYKVFAKSSEVTPAKLSEVQSEKNHLEPTVILVLNMSRGEVGQPHNPENRSRCPRGGPHNN